MPNYIKDLEPAEILRKIGVGVVKACQTDKY